MTRKIESVKNGEFLLYKPKDGTVKANVFFQDETVWLTQKAMAEMFAVKTPAINNHLKNIFETGEQDPVVRLIDFAEPEKNRFHAINQFRIDTPGGREAVYHPGLRHYHFGH